jgi:hypothetical protein
MAVGANNALDGFFAAGEPDVKDVADFRAKASHGKFHSRNMHGMTELGSQTPGWP